mmetsp:Transcript_15613/g.34132  ORF Transcript_15613/g.34132 Transcript_15613/m.34132 type:complete len:236 (-) Transcript_15613:485-1192(-)
MRSLDITQFQSPQNESDFAADGVSRRSIRSHQVLFEATNLENIVESVITDRKIGSASKGRVSKVGGSPPTKSPKRIARRATTKGWTAVRVTSPCKEGTSIVGIKSNLGLQLIVFPPPPKISLSINTTMTVPPATTRVEKTQANLVGTGSLKFSRGIASPFCSLSWIICAIQDCSLPIAVRKATVLLCSDLYMQAMTSPASWLALRQTRTGLPLCHHFVPLLTNCCSCQLVTIEFA